MTSTLYLNWKILFVILIISPLHNADSDIYNYTNLEFPKGFIFGVGTASYQVEGAWNVSGKGENIWDHLVHTQPEAISDRNNGDDACKSYYKYKGDVQLIKYLGFKMYRFSLSWSRLFPLGYTTKINQDGVRYYNSLINNLLANGIQPMVTVYHWDLPQPLEDVGGWLNSSISTVFADYARSCFHMFGDRVKWWLTINEAWLIAEGYGKATYAPRLNLHGTGEYIAGHNVLRAHAKAYRIYDNEFRPSQRGKIGMSFFGTYYFPKDESSQDDIDAAERFMQFEIGWFAHPIFSSEGNYPKVMIDYIYNKSMEENRSVSRLPTFTQEEIEELKGSCDFFGLNHYSSLLAEQGIEGDIPSINSDMEVISSENANWTSTLLPGLQVYPEGLRQILKWIKEQYNNPDIIITENGYCDDGKIEDKERVQIVKDYMRQLSIAINEDGSPVLGYMVWSLMDVFEWTSGYSLKFGLIHVDHGSPDKTRTKKLSAKFFSGFLHNFYGNRASSSTNNYIFIIIFTTLCCLITNSYY